MGVFFLELVNRSITAGWLVLAVLLLRYLLRKSPKWISCLLWGIVALRLICPFSFESAFSLVCNPEPIPVEKIYSEDPEIANNPYHYQLETGVAVIDRTVNPVLTDTSGPVLRSNVLILTGLWLVGAAGMLLYGVISLLRLQRSVSASVLQKGNVYICDEIDSPFILGMIKPHIYLPSGMEEDTQKSVIAHENTHLKRRDHWWKPLGYLLLAAHWFHPLLWIAYGIFCRDIELACDEKAVRDMDREDMAAYAQALLNCSVPRRMVRICPLAFGEIGVKERVKKVLDYKRPVFWVSMVAATVCGVAAVCLLTNPKAEAGSAGEEVKLWFSFLGAETEERRFEQYEPQEISIEAFPNVVFRWSGDKVEAVEEDGSARILYTGRAIWSVYFTDLNNDGKPELCSAISAENAGSDVIDNRIVVYDYSSGMKYELAEPGKQDYTLLKYDGLIGLRQPYRENGLSEEGNLVLADEKLSFVPTGAMHAAGSGSNGGQFQGEGGEDASQVGSNGGQSQGEGGEDAGQAGSNGGQSQGEGDEDTDQSGNNGGQSRDEENEDGSVDDDQSGGGGDQLLIVIPGNEVLDATPAAVPGPDTEETLFSQMAGAFHFLSGAGAWSTELYLEKDGSFVGEYTDAEAGSYSSEYPNGTMYICTFRGAFSAPVKVEELIYSVQILSLEYEEPEKIYIEDGMRYITSTPYGLENAGEVRIYLPGYPLAELPEEAVSWIRNAREYWNGDGPDTLPFYVLYNVEEGEAFFSDGYMPLYGE